MAKYIQLSFKLIFYSSASFYFAYYLFLLCYFLVIFIFGQCCHHLLQHGSSSHDAHQIKHQTTPPKHCPEPQSLFCGNFSWFGCDAQVSRSSSMTDLTSEPVQVSSHDTYLVMQAWQLLAMCCVLFLPQQKYLWFLKAHLCRHADTK